MKTQYVAGFLFNHEKTLVALVKKLKFPPGMDWSANPYNAIGGKIEAGESGEQAMSREFSEETGVFLAPQVWDHFLTLEGPHWVVYFYRGISSLVDGVRQMEAEPIIIADPRVFVKLGSVVPNLRWILPLALDESHVGTAYSQEG